ncbi:Ku protein [Actinacidiphila glaucinigra]|uniref:Ku protein n=1 Tax=Actinacidiphila glaucinigra TaxID=235986 RepID=UPI0036E4AD8E
MAWSSGTLPVYLYSATEKHGSGFHEVHASGGTRIRHRRVWEREYVEVPQSEIARGSERPDFAMGSPCR